MIIRGSLLLLSLLGKRASAEFVNGKPDFFTDDLPAPLAYYYLNDGSGYDLKESVSGDPAAGSVVYDATHQINTNHTEPNWMDDEFFGRTIACGEVSNKTHPTLGAIQKDTLSLKDVDYGHNGAWAWSVWLRHEKGVNFPDFSREQFFGHGDPLQATSTINQVHIQMEKSGVLRTILLDGNDVDRYVYSNQTDDRFPEQTDPLCYDKSECRRATSASSDTDGKIRDYDNGEWHHLVLTTREDGAKGYNLYVDGTLRSSSPYVDGIGIDKGYGNCTNYVNCNGVGGEPIDPIGAIRLCGRAKPAAWSDGEEGQWAWDSGRYFRGQVAHFSVWDSALSGDQVNALHKAYVDQYNIVSTPFPMPEGIDNPLNYYFLDEGYGWDLKESMTNNREAGTVIYDADHQINQEHQGPNWERDEYFGRTIACGDIENKTHPTLGGIQKDTLSLQDVDYGHNGAWAWSVWFRHDSTNFPDFSREQFFGHGDPLQATSTINQVHIQMEKSGVLRTVLLDGNDVDRYVYSDQNDTRFPEQTDPLCYDKSECRRATSASSDTDPNVLKNVDNGNWHQLVLTTREDGAKGYNLYVDSVLQASSPYVEGLGIDKGYSNSSLYVNWAGVGGEPIDPVGPIRLCGRAKPAAWSDGEEGQWEWDSGRYFRGQVAHFAVWDSTLSQEDVQNLYTLYYNQYGLSTQTEKPTTPPTKAPTPKPVPVPTATPPAPTGSSGSNPTAPAPTPTAPAPTPTAPAPTPTAPAPTPTRTAPTPTEKSEDKSTDNNVNKAESTDDDGEGGLGLGTGAIVGIVVGSVVGVSLLAGVGWFAMKQKAGSPASTPNDVANIT